MRRKLTRTFEGKSYFLTKSEHKSLLKRFDAKRFRQHQWPVEWRNEVPCILCSKYNYRTCHGCTFNKANVPVSVYAVSTGCMTIVESLLSEEMRCSLTFAIGRVIFYDVPRAHALAGLKKVMEFLEGFK